MAARTKLWLTLALAGGLAQACQPETVVLVVEACGYRGYALGGEPVILACDSRLATSGLTARDRAAALYERANARLSSGDHDKDRALSDLDLAIRLDPARAEAYILRAGVYARAGDHDRAVADYDQAIRLKPDASTYVARGNSLSVKGAHVRAMSDFDEAVRREPKNGWALTNRADAWLRAGRVDQALADYDKAVLHNPYNIYIRVGRCWAYIIGRPDNALAECDEAVRSSFTGSDALTARGVVHLKARRFHDAIADFDAALQSRPALARALYSRGIARQLKGERQEGRADLAAATAIQADIAREMTKYGVRP